MTRARDVANLIGSGNYSSTTFTATAGQTAFTIAHTQGFVQVFMNGLLLDETADYTSNGTAITLTSGAAAGDEIEVVKYNTFSVGDAIPASGGTFTGSIDASAGLTTPAGHIIQVQSGLLDYMQSTTASFSTIGSLSITPTSASSKVLILFENHIYVNLLSSNLWRGANVRLLRDSTFIYGDSSTGYGHAMLLENDSDRSMLYSTRSYLDSPNTTSSVTYNVQGLSKGGVNTISFNYDTYGGQGRITLMEIAQ